MTKDVTINGGTIKYYSDACNKELSLDVETITFHQVKFEDNGSFVKIPNDILLLTKNAPARATDKDKIFEVGQSITFIAPRPILAKANDKTKAKEEELFNKMFEGVYEVVGTPTHCKYNLRFVDSL